MNRKPIINGTFYPANTKDINDLIKGFIPEKSSKMSAKGLILPHAGYIYSGKVAVATIAQTLPKKRIIILGTNHSGRGPNFSLWDKGSWTIPFGEIDIDEKLAASILANGDIIESDISAHIEEHSIEAELPILYYFFENFKFVPINCKHSTLKNYENAANQIYNAIKNISDEILLIASTDLTHYEPEASARKKDREIIDSIINLDEKSMLQKIDKFDISMCGAAPVAILISCLKKIKAAKSKVIMYQTSGDSSGDYNSVVGYLGALIN